ncbi:MAG: hypothetical protein K0A93_06640 [Desulfuromonadaceae bacterium]|nr:hypothetical protein [Desulfuromonadaceae bacterium]
MIIDNGKEKSFDVLFILLVLIIFLIPSFMFVVFNLSSLSVGLLVSAIFVLIINFKIILSIDLSLKKSILCLAIFLLLLIPSFYQYYMFNIIKPLGSFSFILIIISSYIFSHKIEKMTFNVLSKSLFIVLIFLFSLGWLSILLPIKIGPYAFVSKSVFPFSEESHYALSVGLLGVGYVATGERSSSFFVILNLIFFSIIFPSLTMLLFSVLSIILLSLRMNILKIILLIMILSLLAMPITSKFFLDSDYFTSRLSFSETRNLTTLVFLQGWSLAYQNFIKTNGFGLGFQMLGFPGTQLTPFTEIIEKIDVGSETNLSDGGFLASKIIAEFGIVGILILLMYMKFIIKFIIENYFYWKDLKNNRYCYGLNKSKKTLLLSAILFGFIVEFFFRGYGYFSPGLFLVLSVLGANYKLNFFKY